MGEALGIGIVDPSGTTEIRATYGGLVVGSGLLLLSGLFSRVLAVAALAGTVFGAGGLVSTRIALEIFGGGFSANQLIVIVFEIALVSLAYALLRRAMKDLWRPPQDGSGNARPARSVRGFLAVRQRGPDMGGTLLLASSEAGPDASGAIADLGGQVIAQRTTSLEKDYLALLSAA